MDDARLAVGFPGHPKTKKLIRRVGEAGAFRLVCLILWAAANRPSGDLAGMTAEDIELAADWRGEADAFVVALLAVGFLEGEEGAYRLHDWAEHQPWAAGADLRSAKARWNAISRHHGEDEADRQVPEWATARHATSKKNDAGSKKKRAASKKTPDHGADSAAETGPKDAGSTETDADSTENDAASNAPYPSPSPSVGAREGDARDRVGYFEHPPGYAPPPRPDLAPAIRAAVLMRAAGCNATTVNAYHPALVDAIRAGVMPEALEATALEAIGARKTNPFTWACTTALNRHIQAAEQAQATPPTGGSHATRSQSGRKRGQSLADAAADAHDDDGDHAARRPEPAAAAGDYIEGTAVRVGRRA